MQYIEPLKNGLWGVLATPFTQGASELDDAGMRRQVELHRVVGSQGLVVLGVFGEAARLTEIEQDHLAKLVSTLAGDLPIVVGIPVLSTREVVESAQRIARQCRGRTPSFMVQVNTADPDALTAHLTAVHEATGAGIVVQDYPLASHVKIASADLIKTIRMCPFTVAVKSESPPTSMAVAEITAELDVPVFGGLGGLGLLDELMAGAAGVMTGFSYPEALASVLRAFAEGGYQAAREAYLPWLPLVNFEAQAKIGLGIRKASLAERGIFSCPAVRPPAPSMPDALLPLLRSHLAAVRDRGVL